jgi:type I restriction enzyme S subunit
MDGSRSGIVLKSIGGAIGSTLAVFRLISKEISKEYCYQYFKIKEKEILSKNTGSAIPHANKNYIYGMEMVIPEKKVIEKFTIKSERFSQMITNLHEQNKNLKEARDLLTMLLQEMLQELKLCMENMSYFVIVRVVFLMIQFY